MRTQLRNLRQIAVMLGFVVSAAIVQAQTTEEGGPTSQQRSAPFNWLVPPGKSTSPAPVATPTTSSTPKGPETTLQQTCATSVMKPDCCNAPVLGYPDTVGCNPNTPDTNVAWIDSAILRNQMRTRADASFDNRRPDRAEFIHAQSGVRGPGRRFPETRVDNFDGYAYLETLVGCRLSAFGEGSIRYRDPEGNNETRGLGDANFGVKWAMYQDCRTVGTMQLRIYWPSGDATRGLGTDHLSVEPGVLFYHEICKCLRVEGELRHWMAVDGTSFSSHMIRWGLGVGLDVWRYESFRFTPVVEAVGWRIFDSTATVVHPSGVATIEQVSGQHIVDLKVGLRAGTELGDMYVGYGTSLTGPSWYQNTFRVEVRMIY